MHAEPTGTAARDVAAVREIEAFCLEAESRAPVMKTLWNGWRKGLDSILEKTGQAAPVSRVAVIGSIKSGKSTFVNALLRDDVLRRGAGTITSAVTRVTSAPVPRATITWKGWKKAGAEAGFAAALLAGLTGCEEPPETVDLRREEDREFIRRLLERLGPSPVGLPGHALSQLARLRALWSGFGLVGARLAEEGTSTVLEGEEFRRHREIVSSDDTAAYVDDVRVESPFPEGLPHTEIADCQGSDSLNPSHLVSVQDYLLRTDWAVYLVSSVMGLREADKKLLEVVKSLGLENHVVFVLNADMDAHPGLEDLQRVESTVREWVGSHFGPPRLYTVNLLLELFQGLRDKGALPEREARRLDSWRQDAQMFSALQARWQDLHSFWRDEVAPAAGRLQHTFARRALVNLVGRLRWSLEIAANPREVDLAALKVCVVETENLLPNLESHLQGTTQKAERQVRTGLDDLLHPSLSEAGKAVKTFIQEYRSQWNPEQTIRAGGKLRITGMTLALAEEFNQALQLYLIEKINPAVASQVRELRDGVQHDFSSVLEMYQAILSNNYLKLRQSHRPVSAGPRAEGGPQGEASPGAGSDGGRVEAGGGLARQLLEDPQVELFSLKLELTLTRKVLAVARQRWLLVFRKAKGWFLHRAFKKPLEDEYVVAAEVLLHWREKVVKMLKKEGRALTREGMVRYREHLEYQVLTRYIRDLAGACREELKARFEAFQNEMEQARKAPGLSDREVLGVRGFLPAWQARLKEIESRIRTGPA